MATVFRIVENFYNLSAKFLFQIFEKKKVGSLTDSNAAPWIQLVLHKQFSVS